MTNEAFIEQHKADDVKALALRRFPEEVDKFYCLQQIEGRQLAQKKLPSWAAREGIIYPVRISMEQCSSEATADYKRALALRLLPGERTSMVDLTGGFGVDFSWLATVFDKADYVERNAALCQIARHNFEALGLHHASVHEQDGETFAATMGNYDLIYIDPSRRDSDGRKVVALHDCLPDVVTMEELLLSKGWRVMIKLSPMLDISAALSELHHVGEVHTISVGGECKEVLLVLWQGAGEPSVHCVNIAGETQRFQGTLRREEPLIAEGIGAYLYEPNASILKAGIQDQLCRAMGVGKLHAFSNLFTADEPIPDFPGRRFRVVGMSSFGKKEMQTFLRDMKQCNLTMRNFPLTVQELRKRLKLKEGGSDYLFATTLCDERHVLVRCHPLT